MLSQHLPQAACLPTPTRAAVHEIAPVQGAGVATSLGFLLALLADVKDRTVLWVQPRDKPWRLYGSGLAAFGIDPARFTIITAAKEQDLLWAVEEATAEGGGATVVGVLPEKETVYDFKASRRLALRARERGTTTFLLRPAPRPDASAAFTRWRISPARAGAADTSTLPCWRADLIRDRAGSPRSWQLVWDHETLHLRLAAELADRSTIHHQPERNRLRQTG